MSENNSSQVFAVFRMHSTPNEAKSKEQGRPIFDDMEVCEIRFAGNKQTVGVFPAHEECEWREDPVTRHRERITYAQKYNPQYLAFKQGAAQAASGTPLEELPFLSQGKRLELKALNIYTAEALAGLDGGPLKMLGMNGRDLKDKAQLYLDNAAKTVDVVHLADENKRLREELEQLKSAKPAKPKSARAKNNADEQPDDDEDNPFSEWEADDIKLFIMDGDPEAEIDDNASKEALAKQANELNKKLAKAKKG